MTWLGGFGVYMALFGGICYAYYSKKMMQIAKLTQDDEVKAQSFAHQISVMLTKIVGAKPPSCE